jgi:hypothetical protein
MGVHNGDRTGDGGTAAMATSPPSARAILDTGREVAASQDATWDACGSSPDGSWGSCDVVKGI